MRPRRERQREQECRPRKHFPLPNVRLARRLQQRAGRDQAQRQPGIRMLRKPSYAPAAIKPGAQHGLDGSDGIDALPAPVLRQCEQVDRRAVEPRGAALASRQR